MLHLARKAFYPGAAAVPADARRHDLEVPRHVRVPRPHGGGSRHAAHRLPKSRRGSRGGINPFDHGPNHTRIWKTEGLKQALDLHKFDAAFGGARRDEEKSRAKERIFSFRSREPRLGPEEPAAGALAPLQHARSRRGVDARLPDLQLDRARRLGLHPARAHSDRAALLSPPSGRSSNGRASSSWSTTSACASRPARRRETRLVRFRTLGCYPLSGAIESNATSLEAIVAEMIARAHLGARRPADRPGKPPLRWRRRSARDISDEQGILLARSGRRRRFRRHAALPDLRQRRRRQVDADRPAALRLAPPDGGPGRRPGARFA